MLLLLGYSLGCSQSPPVVTAPVVTEAPGVAGAPVVTEAPGVAGAPGAAAASGPPTLPASLGFADFASIAGVSGRSTLADVEAAWGPGVREEGKITYADGPVVSEFMGGLMIDFMITSKPFIAAHPAPPLALFGATCDDAARVLDFTDTVGGYVTCKHYADGWMTDVTLMCRDKVTSLVVVWVPYPGEAAVADHCD